MSCGHAVWSASSRRVTFTDRTVPQSQRSRAQRGKTAKSTARLLAQDAHSADITNVERLLVICVVCRHGCRQQPQPCLVCCGFIGAGWGALPPNIKGTMECLRNMRRTPRFSAEESGFLTTMAVMEQKILIILSLRSVRLWWQLTSPSITRRGPIKAGEPHQSFIN